jgi:Uma2 family endonuclease
MSIAEAKTRPIEEQRVLFDGVPWRRYEQLLKLLDNRPGVRITYDRGRLEIMTVSYEHSSSGEILGLLVFAIAQAMRRDIRSGGSPTFKKRLKKRGLEPDKCFWVQSFERMRGKRSFNSETDPPPDLAIEVEISRSSLNRMGIYAALQVPEVWRYAVGGLDFYQLGPDGKYVKTPRSIVFPFLAPSDLLRFVSAHPQVGDVQLVEQLQAWVREQLAKQPPTTTPQ